MRRPSSLHFRLRARSAGPRARRGRRLPSRQLIRHPTRADLTWMRSPNRSEKPPPSVSRAYPDLHDHIRALDKAGLLIRVDRPINKDTEMHPLVRWQFRGGIEEKDRKAFLFTNVTDSKGRKYDIPVLVGGLAANREIYRIGIGCRVRGDRRALGHGATQTRSRRAIVDERAVPRDRHHRQGRSTSPARASTAFRCRSRRRAGTSRPTPRCRSTSPRIPTPACRTWATTAAR